MTEITKSTMFVASPGGKPFSSLSFQNKPSISNIFQTDRPYASLKDSPCSSTFLCSSQTDSISSLSFPIASTTTEPVVYEAVLPDSNALIAMGSVILLCVVACTVWANDVVPISRTKLAISKNRGEVKEYLEELKSGSSASIVNGTNTFELQEDELSEEMIIAKSASNEVVDDGRGFERWLFADWLRDNKSGTKKPSAVPFLKDAKWNSGDNPVLVTSGLLLICVLFASITERAGMMGVR